MQNKPNFNIKDATVTQSGKFIRLFGEYEPNAEGKVLWDNILLEIGKFEKMKRTEVEENGKSRIKVEGLIGATLKDPVLRLKKVEEDLKDPSWLVYLHEAKVVFNSGKEYGYKESPPPPKEEQQQGQTQADGPGM